MLNQTRDKLQGPHTLEADFTTWAQPAGRPSSPREESRNAEGERLPSLLQPPSLGGLGLCMGGPARGSGLSCGTCRPWTHVGRHMSTSRAGGTPPGAAGRAPRHHRSPPTHSSFSRTHGGRTAVRERGKESTVHRSSHAVVQDKYWASSPGRTPASLRPRQPGRAPGPRRAPPATTAPPLPLPLPLPGRGEEGRRCRARRRARAGAADRRPAPRAAAPGACRGREGQPWKSAGSFCPDVSTESAVDAGQPATVALVRWRPCCVI